MDIKSISTQNFNRITDPQVSNRTNLPTFKQHTRNELFINGDEFRIHTPKEGLIKKNSFLHPNIEVKNKSCAGKGVFATGPIYKGEIVCIFVGDILDVNEVEGLPEDLQCKVLQLAPNIYQVGSKNPEGYRVSKSDPTDEKVFDTSEYFNHSCDPNLCITGNNVLIAIKDIKKGEELNVDYGTFDTGWNPNIDSSWKCKCGSPNCRIYNDPDAYIEIIEKLRRTYGEKNALNLVADYVKKMYINQKNVSYQPNSQESISTNTEIVSV